MDTFKTLARPSEASLIVQRSKFLAFARPVVALEEALEAVNACRKEYHDARHICWACHLGLDQPQFRVNDDGEPASTAGKPILAAIRAAELTNILIIVVRYFGGVKLGIPGLIAAYRSAARAALQSAQIVEKTTNVLLIVRFKYPFLSPVMRIVKEMHAQFEIQSLDADCRLVLQIRQSQAEQLAQRLLPIESLLIESSALAPPDL
jgi:uncharacterized YigZ family protein